MKLQSTAFLTLVIICLTVSSCSSSKKKGADGSVAGQNADAAQFDNGKNNGMNLELNGEANDSSKTGSFKNIYFDFNSAGLSDESKETLNQNAQILKAAAALKVQVEGHTDERGGVQFNLSLGERRAKTVREYLMGLGVEGSRISIISLGKEKPVVFGHDESSWAKNRRANFVIITK